MNLLVLPENQRCGKVLANAMAYRRY